MDFTLSTWVMEDLPSLVKYANNIEIAKYLNDHFPHPYTIEDGKNFIELATNNPTAHILAIGINGEAAGGIGLHPLTGIERKNAELGYWLAEPFWGKGIMTKAVARLVAFGFENYDINRIFARPFGTNSASQKVLEKSGFVLEAHIRGAFYKNGESMDELIYAVRRSG